MIEGSGSGRPKICGSGGFGSGFRSGSGTLLQGLGTGRERDLYPLSLMINTAVNGGFLAPALLEIIRVQQ